MSKKQKEYEVFSRKYRPTTFDEVVGQEHITTTLKNAISTGHVAHAYLFTGPRGIGKTSTARILAKALNCEKGPTTEPCNICDFCKEINNGNALDVIEIDGASNTSVDNIREIKQNVLFISRPNKKKIYIIDEVHQISNAGFNALLKTLEEPPEYVIFIFATTEPQKIPMTILSRCQRFDFRRIPVNLIVEQLNSIVNLEKININEEAVFLIAEKADGSMRDAEVLLDQLISTTDAEISTENIRQLFGVVDYKVHYDFIQTFITKESKKGLEIIDEIFINGYDISLFLEDLLNKLRNIMFLKINPKLHQPLFLSDRERNLALKIADGMDISMISGLSQKFVGLLGKMKFSFNPRVLLEINYIYCLNLQEHIPLSEILNKMDKLTGKGFISSSEDLVEDSEQVKSESISELDREPDEPDDSVTDELPLPEPESSTKPQKKSEDGKLDWKGFLKYLDENKVSISFYLKNSVLSELSDAHVIIGFSGKDRFKREFLDKTDKKDILKELFFKYFQLKREIKFQVQGDIVIVEDTKDRHEMDKKEIEAEIKAKEPNIITAKEMFSGTIKDIKIK